uniref:F-box domain-containing protein n=1 Tax=Strongyloides papillosus TaxID=174720 RepID=A0A0N5CEA7_STREA
MKPKEASFLDLMNNGLVRKEIFKMLSFFHDISNLSRTCQELNWITDSEIFLRTMSFYHDFQSVNIRIKEETPEDLSVVKMDNIIFEKDERFFLEKNFFNKYFGETILKSNCTTIFYSNWIEEFAEDERKLFIDKLSNEMDLNCRLRSNTKILDFMIDFSYHTSMILNVLSSMKHQNISHIKVSDIIFMEHNTNVYKELKSNIFDGFPNFHKLEIECIFFVYYYKRFIKNGNILEKIFSELSKRKNATLILNFSHCEYDRLINFVYMILEITRSYKIKLKCNIMYVLESIDGRNNINWTIHRSIYLPIKLYLTSLTITIANSKYFRDIMKSLQNFTNLETLQLEFLFFDIKKNIKVEERIHGDCMSLKNLTKLTNLKLYFAEFINRNNNLNVKKFCSNLMYLFTLMPKYVHKLELIVVPILTNEVAKIINEFLPNLEILVTYRVLFYEADCLLPLKNLHTLICHERLPNLIPNTIELLAIKQKISEENNAIAEENQKLIDAYSKNFTKILFDIDGRYVFFNNIRKWNFYKHVIEESFW